MSKKEWGINKRRQIIAVGETSDLIFIFHVSIVNKKNKRFSLEFSLIVGLKVEWKIQKKRASDDDRRNHEMKWN